MCSRNVCNHSNEQKLASHIYFIESIPYSSLKLVKKITYTLHQKPTVALINYYEKTLTCSKINKTLKNKEIHGIDE